MYVEKEVRVLGICEECGREITEYHTKMYADKDGYRFCSVECVLAHYDVDTLEI